MQPDQCVYMFQVSDFLASVSSIIFLICDCSFSVLPGLFSVVAGQQPGDGYDPFQGFLQQVVTGNVYQDCMCAKRCIYKAVVFAEIRWL